MYHRSEKFARLRSGKYTVFLRAKLKFSLKRSTKTDQKNGGKRVCKTAFRKVYGISKSKIEVFLKKIDQDGPEKRGQKTPRKLLPEARDAVIDFILSYDATESHYRRARNGCKKYFDSNISMR